MLASKRSTPLTIAAPPGAKAHLARLQEALFPGSHVMEPKFDVEHIEIPPESTVAVAGLTVTAIAARHTRETNPLALRINVGGADIAYTGDGELAPELAELVSGVDLLIAECYFFDKPVRWHLNYPDIAHLEPKRIVLTHMHSSMLERVDDVAEECAYDGFTLTV